MSKTSPTEKPRKKKVVVADDQPTPPAKKKRSPEERALARDYGATKANGEPLSRKLMGVHAMWDELMKGPATVAGLVAKLSKYGITEGEVNAQKRVETQQRKPPRWSEDKKGRINVVEGAVPNWRTGNGDA